MLRTTIRHQTRFLTALQGRGDAHPAFHAAIYRVHGAVAGVALSFPATESGLSEVAVEADAVKHLLLKAETAMGQAMIIESDPLFDAETLGLLQVSNDARDEFARRANLEIGRGRSWWSKVWRWLLAKRKLAAA